MPTDDTPLNNTLRRLQQQRDDGIISAEEYRRKAAAAMDEHDPEKGPDSLASLRAPGQSLTGELGVDLAKNTPESWLHSAVGAINAKKWVLALAFFLLVAALTTATGVELSENVWGMVDKNAGKRLKVHVPTEEEHYSKEAESGSGVSTTLDVSDDEDELGRKEAERLTQAEAGGEEEGGDDSAAAEEGTD